MTTTSPRSPGARPTAATALAVAALAGCSSHDDLRCGAGTTLSGGACITPAPPGAWGTVAERCGTGTVQSGDFCVPDGPAVADTAPCMAGAKVLHVDGNGSILTGSLTLTSASWTNGSGPSSDSLYYLVDTNDPNQGDQWALMFESHTLGVDLLPGVYDNATRAAFASPGTPGLDISGFHSGCNTIAGRFQVHDIELNFDNTVDHVLLSFQQLCEGSLTGCLRYTR